MRSIVVILTLLTLTPLVAADTAAGPDAEGAWTLSYDVTRDAPGRVAASLDVMATDAGATTHGARDLGTLDLPAGATRLNVSFLPAEGPGDYAVSLVLDGAASPPLTFHVEGSHGASAQVSFAVPDEPTWLNLTSDGVNADGKLKSPGDDVITRATVHDGNGLGDLDPALRWSVDGAGYHDEGTLPLPATPSSPDASVEHRWHASPLANGTYRLTLSATRGGSPLANATRTFVVKEIPPTLAPLAVPDATPDADVSLPVDVTLADRNGAPGAGTLEARLYRGSQRADGLDAAFAGGNATVDLARGQPRGVADGAGLTAYPLTIRVPAGAAPGQVRLSVLLNGTLLGSATFNVTALPTLANVTATPEGDALRIEASGSGQGILHVELRDGNATNAADAPFVNGSAHAILAAPSPARLLRWNATLLARDGGAPLAWREEAWARASPNVTLRLLRGLPRLPAAWSVEAPGWDLAGARANVTFTRWDGAPEPNLTASLDGSTLEARGPPSLAPGRYAMAVRLAFANGTVGLANATLDAGPWIRVHLGAANVTGRDARLPLANDGGLAVRRLVVEVDGNLTASLLVNGTAMAPHVSASGRLVFDGLALAPGDSAVLDVRLPDGPLPAGAHAAAVRVLALPGGG